MLNFFLKFFFEKQILKKKNLKKKKIEKKIVVDVVVDVIVVDVVVVVVDVVVVVVVVVFLLLLSLSSQSALVTRTGSDSYRLGFSTQVLKLSSGELGKIVVAAAAAAAAAGIVRTRTLRDQYSRSECGGSRRGCAPHQSHL